MKVRLLKLARPMVFAEPKLWQVTWTEVWIILNIMRKYLMTLSE